MEILLVFIIIFGAICIATCVAMGTAWVICKALLLLFGLTVSFWGVFLLIIAVQLVVCMFRGGK